MKMDKIIIREEFETPLVIENDEFLSLMDFRISEADQQQAMEELNETPQSRTLCLEKLKKKLQKDKKTKYRNEDYYLLRFLRVRKFDVEKAYSTVKEYYRIRSNHPDFFHLPCDFEDKLKTAPCKFLPYRDKEGRMIFWVTFQNWDVDELPMVEFISYLTAMSDVITLNPNCQISGSVAIVDGAGVTMRHFLQFISPSHISAIAKIMQESYPWRNKLILMINSSRIIQFMWSVTRTFLKKKMADRAHMLGSDMSELHEFLSPDILPKELGGTLSDEQCEKSTQFVLDNLNYLKYDRSFGSET